MKTSLGPVLVLAELVSKLAPPSPSHQLIGPRRFSSHSYPRNFPPRFNTPPLYLARVQCMCTSEQRIDNSSCCFHMVTL